MTTYDKFRHYESELQRLHVTIFSINHGELRVVNRTRAVARYIQLMWKLRPHIVHSWLHYPNLIARIARPFCPPHQLITAVRSHYSHRALISEKRTQWLSDFRIVITEEAFTKQSISLHKPITLVIPNGIDYEFFKQVQKPKDNIFSAEDPFIALMAARIDPRKGHQTLLNAVHHLKNNLPPNLKIILIGEVTDADTQQQINKTIADFSLETVICQQAATDNIIPYYLDADISILPSYSEEFPNVVLESLATGTPAIVSEAANRSGIVQHQQNGWVFPTGDSLALADCLKAAWETSAEQRRLMGEQGRTIAAQYTIEKMVIQYEHLYERALKRS